MLFGYKNTLFGTGGGNTNFVEFLLNNGSQYKIKQPMFGSVLGLKTTGDVWRSEVQQVFPSTNASLLVQITNKATEITSIGNYGFYSLKNLISVKDDSESITTIGSYAFQYCFSLTTASFPNVTSIGSSAFYSCINLTRISAPNVKTIDLYAFCRCSKLTSVTLPNVSVIGYEGFARCSALSMVSFNNVVEIQQYAFSSCSNLAKAYILTDVIPSIPTSQIFSGCASNLKIFVKESMYDRFITNPRWSTFTASRFAKYSFDLSNADVMVNSQNYTGNPIIPRISVQMNGASLEKDKDYTLTCTNNVEIGTASFTLTGLGEYYGTYQGTFEIAVINNTLFTITTQSASPNNKFGIYSATKSADAPSITINWGDGNIDTFSSNVSNQIHTYSSPGTYEVEIDDTITTLTGTTTATNYECNYQLTDVKFGGKLTSLGNYAFYYATQLPIIDLTNCNITSIGNYTFRYCSNVKEIKIGKQVTTFGTAPFDTRGTVDKITVEDGNPNFSVENGILKSNTGILYKVDSTFDGVIPSGITNIQIYGLAYSDIRSIVIPSFITTIATYVCAYCNNLIYAEYNPGTTTAANYTFRNCTNLKYVKIINNVTSFGTGFVNGCSSLEVIDFSERTATTIPTVTTGTTSTGPFYNVPDGVKVVVPDSLYESWGANANWKTWITNGKIILVKASEFTGSKDDYL